LIIQEAKKLGLDFDKNFTSAGSGGSSDAYFVHPEIPARLQDEWMTEEIRRGELGLVEDLKRAWVSENATQVIKIRRPRDDFSKTAMGLLRDQSLQRVANDLASRARYDGAPLIRVASWSSTPEELSRGIIRQDVVRGPTARDLEKAAWRVQTFSGMASIRVADQVALEDARRLLAEAGLSPDEALDRVAAVEDFYRKSHNTAVEFARTNGLPLYGNRTSLGNPEVIGLDYNHGTNVAWDRDTRQFVMFDW